MAESFKDYKWCVQYRSSSLNAEGKPTNILHEFYIPALKRAVKYDRVAGYFRSSSLAAASQGYTAFLKNGGRMRLIVGADMQVQDVAAILAGNKQRLSDSLMKELQHPESWPDEVTNGVALLGEMVASGQLSVKVAFRINAETHQPIAVDSTEDGYVHEKWLVLTDDEGNRIYGSGSINESRTALTLNAENIDVSCDWKGETDRERADLGEQGFETLWENRLPHMVVKDIPDAVRERLIQLKDMRNRPTEIDGTVQQVHSGPSILEQLKFAVLKDAPMMPGGIYIGMYSAPVLPWPHQETVSRKLIESWPYSYMLCDEVGLGKTIEAALAIRSLVLSGWAKRVMIIAPKSLTDQWHRELAGKAMLPFYKTRVRPGQTGKMDHIRIFPDKSEYSDASMYSPALNIISSGLVSRKERRQMLEASDDCEVILVDEAHYARRQNPRGHSSEAPKYGNLYAILQDVVMHKAKSLWLATATPMQIDPIEVYDLFRLAGRSGPFLADPTLSMEYFDMTGAIAKGNKLGTQQWMVLGRSYAQIEALDPFLWNILNETTVSSKNRKVLQNLYYKEPKNADVRYLKQPLFAASPLSRVMMRHSRQLLEIYRRNGELRSNLAKRKVRPVCAVAFTPDEEALYDLLESYCKGLEQQVQKNNPQAMQVMNFLLNFLQLRFASSLYAIQQTLKRRLARVNATLIVGAKRFETQEELDEALSELADSEGLSEEYGEGDIDDITLDALLKDRTVNDLKWEQGELSAMIDLMDAMQDTPSKIKTLLEEIDRRRTGDRVRQTVIFTRFYDSLKSIRDYLSVRASTLRVGVYSGDHAEWFNPVEGKDIGTSHERIKDLFLAGEIDILLCTDAAAEGLNLQTADLLINFDLGWNPMKVEQRIGRIDRIGQKYDEIEVMNMCYLGSTEEIVYGRLFDRLSKAGFVVGTQQISMLPVTQEEFRALASGKMTPEELETKSKEKLKKQKEATAAMEIPAEEMYEMYRRQSNAMSARSMPAKVDDVKEALLSSEYLKSIGIKAEDNEVMIPDNEDTGGLYGTFDRDKVHEGLPFLTWGNSQIDHLMATLSEGVETAGCVKRITAVFDGIEYVGYAVAVDDEVKLVVSYKDLDGICINEQHVITESEANTCNGILYDRCAVEQKALVQRRESQKVNDEFAHAHEKLLKTAAIEILKTLAQHGTDKFWEAVRYLEANEKASYHVMLPESFTGQDMKVLFPIINSTTAPQANVTGLMLLCVIELMKRSASRVKKKKSEITSAEIIRRLERNER